MLTVGARVGWRPSPDPLQGMALSQNQADQSSREVGFGRGPMSGPQAAGICGTSLSTCVPKMSPMPPTVELAQGGVGWDLAVCPGLLPEELS